MAKYSFEFKLLVVESYLAGEGGYKWLAEKHKISDESVVRDWVRQYRAQGVEGLKRSRQNNKYTLDFKLKMVECYLSSEISYRDLATAYGIRNPSTITNWVIKYRSEGVAGLDKHQGRPSKVKKSKEVNKSISKKTSKKDSNKIKELELENRLLKIENAYLKKLEEFMRKEERKK